VVGVNYPARLTKAPDHTPVSKANMEKMAAAYKVHNGLGAKKPAAGGGGGAKKKAKAS
jgi:hypothetical protein